MASQPIRVLLIEDDPDDILLLKESLAEIGLGRIKLDYVNLLSRGLIQLGGQSYDVVLLDLNLPDSRGLDTLNTTIKRFPKIPVVVLSGLADDVITIEAVRRGAQDYLVKGEISGPLVMRVLRYAIERKQVEVVLRTNEARYRTLVETSPNGITLSDMEGNLVLCNQQAARLHGYDNPEAMIGLHVLKLVAPDNWHQADINFHKTLNDGEVTNAEYALQRKDGNQFPAEISTALIRNTSGAPTGFIGITRDISERKQALEAEQKLAMLQEEFIFSLSNELRTPLVSLVGYLDRLRDDKLNGPDVKDQFLNHASMEAYRLLDRVNELLDYSLLESKRLALNWEKVDLVRIINDVLRSFREQAIARRVTLMAAPMDNSLLAEVDPSRVRRMLFKLVENAIKFSDEGGRVFITAKPIDDKVIINVIDEGCGISFEDSSRIFEKYYQVKETPNKKPYAMGIGLYLAKHVAEAHGGSLTVSSQLGSGSIFTIVLPVTKRI